MWSSFKGMCAYIALMVMGFPSLGQAQSEDAAPLSPATRPLVMMAPSSLIDVLSQFEFEFDQKYAYGTSISYAATSVNARHIFNGAPAHLIITAHPAWMQELLDQGAIRSEDVQSIARTSLVIAVRTEQDTLQNLQDVLNMQGANLSLGMGDPRHVPVGIYAKQALVNTELWEKVSDKIVPMVNARNSVVSLLRGVVTASVIYGAEAHTYARKLRVIHKLPEHAYDPVQYQLAPVTGQDHIGQSAFAAFITDAASKAIWKTYGFQPIE